MADVVARPGAAGTAGARPAGGSGAGGGGGPVVEKRSFIAKLVDFYNGVVVEMKKVTWPDVTQVRQATISIIIFVLILGLLITILDFALQGILIRGIPSLFAGR